MKTLDVFNPLDQQIIGQFELENKAKIQEKIERCANQFENPLSLQERKAGLKAWADLIEQQKQLLAGLITKEQGKPLSQAVSEVDYALSYIYFYHDLITDEFFAKKETSSGVFESVRPLGVCAFITPWNFPIAMLVRKVAPAIAAGNTVIAKPSELTPLSAKAIHALFEQAFAVKGLFELCICDAPLFSDIVMKAHRIRKISFTGSTKVGRLLIEQSALDIKKLSLELGGYAPCIVSQHADLEQALEGVMNAKFRNAGQTCVAINHLYVHKDIEPLFNSMLQEKIKSLKAGDGLLAQTDIGPIIHKQALEQRNRWIQEAVNLGATIECVGENTHRESCMPAILMRNVPQDCELNKNELFAPILLMSTYDSICDVIDKVNESKMGLAAYLFSKDEREIELCEQKIHTGMIGINTGSISNAKAPFGGVKHSGFGREGAIAGINEFLTIHYSAQI